MSYKPYQPDEDTVYFDNLLFEISSDLTEVEEIGKLTPEQTAKIREIKNYINTLFKD